MSKDRTGPKNIPSALRRAGRREAWKQLNSEQERHRPNPAALACCAYLIVLVWSTVNPELLKVQWPLLSTHVDSQSLSRADMLAVVNFSMSEFARATPIQFTDGISVFQAST